MVLRLLTVGIAFAANPSQFVQHAFEDLPEVLPVDSKTLRREVGSDGEVKIKEEDASSNFAETKSDHKKTTTVDRSDAASNTGSSKKKSHKKKHQRHIQDNKGKAMTSRASDTAVNVPTAKQVVISKQELTDDVILVPGLKATWQDERGGTARYDTVKNPWAVGSATGFCVSAGTIGSSEMVDIILKTDVNAKTGLAQCIVGVAMEGAGNIADSSISSIFIDYWDDKHSTDPHWAEERSTLEGDVNAKSPHTFQGHTRAGSDAFDYFFFDQGVRSRWMRVSPASCDNQGRSGNCCVRVSLIVPKDENSACGEATVTITTTAGTESLPEEKEEAFPFLLYAGIFAGVLFFCAGVYYAYTQGYIHLGDKVADEVEDGDAETTEVAYDSTAAAVDVVAATQAAEAAKA